ARDDLAAIRACFEGKVGCRVGERRRPEITVPRRMGDPFGGSPGRYVQWGAEGLLERHVELGKVELAGLRRRRRRRRRRRWWWRRRGRRCTYNGGRARNIICTSASATGHRDEGDQRHAHYSSH